MPRQDSYQREREECQTGRIVSKPTLTRASPTGRTVLRKGERKRALVWTIGGSRRCQSVRHPSFSAQNGLAGTVFLANAAHGGKQYWSEYGKWKQKTGGFSQPEQPHWTYSRHPERFWVAGGGGKGKKVERVRVMIQTGRRPESVLGREREVQIRGGPIPMLVFFVPS